MNPLALKFILGGALLVALLAGGWYVKSVIAENAELKIETEQQAQAIDNFRKAAKAEQDSAVRLAAERAAIDAQLADLQTQIQAKPLTRVVTREVLVQGEIVTTTCVERDPDRYRLLFNTAIAGADPAAAGMPQPVPSQ